MTIQFILKAIISILLFISALYSTAQTTINFTYDAGGNMIKRSIAVIPPTPGAKFTNPFTQAEEKNDSLNVVEFKVYPNPTREIVNLEGDLPVGIESAKVFLFNTTGQVLKTETYTGASTPINVGDLKAGIYYLEVNYSKKNSSSYKIIITN